MDWSEHTKSPILITLVGYIEDVFFYLYVKSKIVTNIPMGFKF